MKQKEILFYLTNSEKISNYFLGQITLVFVEVLHMHNMNKKIHNSTVISEYESIMGLGVNWKYLMFVESKKKKYRKPQACKFYL